MCRPRAAQDAVAKALVGKGGLIGIDERHLVDAIPIGGSQVDGRVPIDLSRRPQVDAIQVDRVVALRLASSQKVESVVVFAAHREAQRSLAESGANAGGTVDESPNERQRNSSAEKHAEGGGTSRQSRE
jgi:hypothetical protein